MRQSCPSQPCTQPPHPCWYIQLQQSHQKTSEDGKTLSGSWSLWCKGWRGKERGQSLVGPRCCWPLHLVVREIRFSAAGLRHLWHWNEAGRLPYHRDPLEAQAHVEDMMKHSTELFSAGSENPPTDWNRLHALRRMCTQFKFHYWSYLATDRQFISPHLSFTYFQIVPLLSSGAARINGKRVFLMAAVKLQCKNTNSKFDFRKNTRY